MNCAGVEDTNREDSDIWSEWLLHHRHGRNAQHEQDVRAYMTKSADRVLASVGHDDRRPHQALDVALVRGDAGRDATEHSFADPVGGVRTHSALAEALLRAWRPQLRVPAGRVDNAWRERDIVRESCQQLPSSYVVRFSVDSAVFDPGALRLLVDMMGEERVLLGSDYPFPLGEKQIGSLIDLGEPLEPRLNREFDVSTESYVRLVKRLKSGVEEGRAAYVEIEGAAYRRGRVAEASRETAGMSVESALLRDVTGQYHCHTNGEVNMIIPLENGAVFCGHCAGWRVFPPLSEHFPTVTGKALMMYFLPGGEIEYRTPPAE